MDSSGRPVDIVAGGEDCRCTSLGDSWGGIAMYEGPPFYLSEDEIAAKIGFKPEKWAELAKVYLQAGMPRVDPICGMRYWPAVRAFFDRHNRLSYYTDPELDLTPQPKARLDAFKSKPRRKPPSRG